MKIFSKTHKIIILTLLTLLLVASLFLLREERELFFTKIQNFYLSARNTFLLNQNKMKAPEIIAPAWAVYPPVVRLLPNCPFTNVGQVGDIFVKNRKCNWSDYKCSLTDYRNCNGYMDMGQTVGDACYCNSYNYVCGIATMSQGYSYCFAVLRSDGTYFATSCDFCVRQ